MRETKFIEQNKKKWQKLEQMLETEVQDPEKLNDQFVQVTDDLSYSRTFYPNRSVRVYLNGLAQRIFSSIYKGKKKTDANRFKRFWLEEIPQLVYESRTEFFLAFGLFALSMIIGVVSSIYDPEFVRHILGDGYVDMTIDNIEKGDPMAVYKDREAFGMSLGITANNIWVAFLTFIMGVFYAIGTVWILIQNGIMVGAFQYFFVQEGLFQESFLTIWTHGTLEISAIVIAGAAGLTMGRGLVFPGTYSRTKAFQLSARRGLKIYLALVPVFLMAGFIEGYLTRQTDTPDAIRLGFILVCLAFILGYFVVFPWLKAKRGFDSDVLKTTITPDKERKIFFGELKTSGQVFSEVFIFYKKHFRTIFLASIAAAILWCGVFFGFSNRVPSEAIIQVAGGYDIGQFFDIIGDFFVNENLSFLPILNGFTYAIIAVVVFTKMAKDAGVKLKYHSLISYSKMAVCCTGLAVILAAPAGLTFLLMITIFPIILIWMYTMIGENLSLFNSPSRALGLVGTSFWNMMGLYAVLMITGALFIMLSDTMITHILLEAIGLNFNFQDEALKDFYTILSSFFAVTLMKMVFAMLLAGFGLFFYTLREIKDADVLKDRIDQLGSRKRIRGMEWEG